MNLKQLRAFSLVEMMIVVAIMAILATLAMASYSRYTLEARAATLLNAAGPAQLAVDQYFAKNSTLNITSVGTESYVISPDITLISTIAINAGTINVQGTALANKLVISLIPTIQYIPSTTTVSGLTWTCSTPAAFINYVPVSCQTACTANAGTC